MKLLKSSTTLMCIAAALLIYGLLNNSDLFYIVANIWAVGGILLFKIESIPNEIQEGILKDVISDLTVKIEKEKTTI